MKNRLLFKVIIIILTVILTFTGCSYGMFSGNSENTAAKNRMDHSGISSDGAAGTEKSPDTLKLDRGRISSIPSYDRYSSEAFQVDLRGYDLSSLKLNNCKEELLQADFDTSTIWPFWLSDGFNPKNIMENGKNPGLGINELHKLGITGDGVSVAIIGDAILTNHVEYKKNLSLYTVVGSASNVATVEGCASVSAAVGRTTGVAPDASVYYITIGQYKDSDTDKGNSDFNVSNNDNYQFTYYNSLTNGIQRVLDINQMLPVGDKIRVICIAGELSSEEEGYRKVEQKIAQAVNKGIFVVSNSLYDTYDGRMSFNGLGRDPMSDPDDLSTYRPDASWIADFYNFGRCGNAEQTLLIPEDSRCFAAPTGSSDYAYYRNGTPGMGISYIGGLFALMCQVEPELTPERFWKAALETGNSLVTTRNNIHYKLEKVVNPVRLYKKLCQ